MKTGIHALVKRTTIALVLSGGPLALACDDGGADVPGPPVDALTHVDPLIATAGGGWGQPQVFPGAALPFGMVRVGPDTSGYLPRGTDGFAHTAGYWYLDDYIDGFSQLHLSGTGVEDLGNFLLMPTVGMSASKTTEDGYRQVFSHDDEDAAPGYYRVRLEDHDIEAELTASAHAALHRYTWPAERADDAVLILDVGHGIGREGASDGELSVSDDGREISGWMTNAGRFTGESGAFDIFFALELVALDGAGQKIDDSVGVGTFSEVDGYRPDTSTTSGVGLGAWLVLPDATRTVEVRVGVSLFSVDRARQNRGEVDGKDFATVRAAAEAAWAERLHPVRVWGGEVATHRAFFSALYRAHLMPTLLSEYDTDDEGVSIEGTGRYVGLDREAHDDEGTAFYSDLSLWDTYRTVHPLYALIAPDAADAFAQSLVRMADQIGYLPRWPLWVNETGTMVGAPATIALVDTVLRRHASEDLGFDLSRAMDQMVADAEYAEGATIRAFYETCERAGYCPADEVGRGVAQAVEYGWADFALLSLAEARGDAAAIAPVRARLRERVGLYRGHFDDDTGFLRGRNRDGSWTHADGFDPTEMSEDYAEGNAWHYVFSAPYDISGLVELFGGRAQTLEKLREMFEGAASEAPRYLLDEYRLPDPYYWHSNEPDLHASFVFALLGEPGEGARWIDWVRTEKHDDTPWGLDGNDDAGTLSAWYVWACLGLYPLSGSDVWILGTPLFERVELDHAGGTLTITAERRSPDAVVPVEVRLDGAPVEHAFLTHAQLANARHLAFVLDDAGSPWSTGEVWSSHHRELTFGQHIRIGGH